MGELPTLATPLLERQIGRAEELKAQAPWLERAEPGHYAPVYLRGDIYANGYVFSDFTTFLRVPRRSIIRVDMLQLEVLATAQVRVDMRLCASAYQRTLNGSGMHVDWSDARRVRTDLAVWRGAAETTLYINGTTRNVITAVPAGPSAFHPPGSAAWQLNTIAAVPLPRYLPPEAELIARYAASGTGLVAHLYFLGESFFLGGEIRP